MVGCPSIGAVNEIPPVPVTPQPGSTGPGDAWLLPRLQMQFRAVSGPIGAPVAKLGGQPVWLEEPTWPLSRPSNTPMMFVGQFPVPGDPPRLAYLFLSDDDDGLAESFDPEAGENALLVQPGGRIPSFVDVTATATGPCLWRRGATWNDKVPVELAVDLTPLNPLAEGVLDAQIARQEAERAGGAVDLPDGGEAPGAPLPPYSYLGGKVHLWQPSLDVDASWRFFFQVDGAEGHGPEDPYALNFGGGSGYAFLSEDRREGRFYWDCV